MRVLICGAGSMLAHDVIEVAEDAGHDLIALTSAQCDVTDRDAVREWTADARPDAVINCAAWTDVDGAEEHEDEAFAINAEGAGNVADAAADAGASVLYVSTDYVFDGRNADGYVEDDPTAPLSAYGRTKLAGEQRTLAATADAFVVRTAWLFGTHGRNFVETMLRRAAERDELRVVDDQVGCPTWSRHLAEALVALCASDDYGIHHLAGAGAVSWYGFAHEIFARAGVKCHVEPCSSAEHPRPAPRPRFSVLRSTRGRSLPAWQVGLDGYLSARKAAA